MAGEPNQGATGTRPMSEPPLAGHAAGSDNDAFAERPEVFVGAAFAGGFALALLLKKVAA